MLHFPIQWSHFYYCCNVLIGMDYTAPFNSLVLFPPGSNSSSPPVCTVMLSIIDDTVDELLEQFIVSLIPVLENPVQVTDPSTAIVNITRDPDDGNQTQSFLVSKLYQRFGSG